MSFIKFGADRLPLVATLSALSRAGSALFMVLLSSENSQPASQKKSTSAGESYRSSLALEIRMSLSTCLMNDLIPALTGRACSPRRQPGDLMAKHDSHAERCHVMPKIEDCEGPRLSRPSNRVPAPTGRGDNLWCQSLCEKSLERRNRLSHHSIAACFAVVGQAVPPANCRPGDSLWTAKKTRSRS